MLARNTAAARTGLLVGWVNANLKQDAVLVGLPDRICFASVLQVLDMYKHPQHLLAPAHADVCSGMRSAVEEVWWTAILEDPLPLLRAVLAWHTCKMKQLAFTAQVMRSIDLPSQTICRRVTSLESMAKKWCRYYARRSLHSVRVVRWAGHCRRTLAISACGTSFLTCMEKVLSARQASHAARAGLQAMEREDFLVGKADFLLTMLARARGDPTEASADSKPARAAATLLGMRAAKKSAKMSAQQGKELVEAQARVRLFGPRGPVFPPCGALAMSLQESQSPCCAGARLKYTVSVA